MARQPRVPKPKPEKFLHYVYDPNVTEIADQKVTDEHRKDGIMLTSEEAVFYVASGTVGTVDPKESEGVKRAMAGFKNEVPNFEKLAKAQAAAEKAPEKAAEKPASGTVTKL